MNSFQRNQRNRNSKRSVFRSANITASKTVRTQYIESLVIFFIGLLSVYLINLLPRNIDTFLVLSQAIGKLISGISLLIEAFTTFVLLILILSVVMLGLFLLFSGSVRILKLLSSKRRTKSRYRHHVHMLKKRWKDINLFLLYLRSYY